MNVVNIIMPALRSFSRFYRDAWRSWVQYEYVCLTENSLSDASSVNPSGQEKSGHWHFLDLRLLHSHLPYQSY